MPIQNSDSSSREAPLIDSSGYIPEDLIKVGRVGEPYGLKGGVHVIPYSGDASALRATRDWWLSGPGSTALRHVEALEVLQHGSGLTVRLMGYADRDLAARLKGAEISVPRSRFPVLDEGEYYWHDLPGLEVFNLDGEFLGRVSELTEHAAHPILRVCDDAGSDEKNSERLIPFVGAIVRDVNLVSRRITVDWGVDY